MARMGAPRPATTPILGPLASRALPCTGRAGPTAGVADEAQRNNRHHANVRSLNGGHHRTSCSVGTRHRSSAVTSTASRAAHATSGTAAVVFVIVCRNVGRSSSYQQTGAPSSSSSLRGEARFAHDAWRRRHAVGLVG